MKSNVIRSLAIAAVLILTACSSTSAESTSPDPAPSPTPTIEKPDASDRHGEPIPDSHGKSFSYAKSVSLVIPAHWTYQEEDYDVLAEGPSLEARNIDYVGTWLLSDYDSDTPHTLGILHTRKDDPTQSARKILEGIYPLGVAVADGPGKTKTATEFGTAQLVASVPVEWTDVAYDDESGFTIYQRVFLIDSGDGSVVVVYLTATELANQTFIDESLEVLATIEFHGTP